MARGHFFRDLVAGLVVSLMAISFYVSCAALLFQGPLSMYLAQGVGMSLAGGALMSLAAFRTSSMPLASLGPEPATVPILAAMTAAIAAACSPAAALPTAVVALCIACLLIGLGWFLLGRKGAGDLVRYIPYPVIGGFLSAVGWLMVSGGAAVSQGASLTPTSILAMFREGPHAQLVVGTAVALAIWGSTLRFKHTLLIPGLIVASCLAVHAGLWAVGLDPATARAGGWLMPAFGLILPPSPLQPALFSAVDWGVVAAQSGLLAVSVAVSVIGLLLAESSLEVAFDTRADFNADLKLLGVINMVLAPLGGLQGGVSVSRSLATREAGAVGRLAGAVNGAACLGVMLVGGPVLALIPKPVLGGLLMFLGLGILKAWLYDGRKRLSRGDYAVVVAILLLTIAFGYLQAVIAGVVICCFDFAVSSARVGPVRRNFSRNEWPGSVERAASEVTLLRAQGERVRVVELQGTLFFGSIRRLGGELEALMTRSEAPIDLLVLDFRRVPAMDSSAAQALARVLKVAAAQGVALAYSGMSARVGAVLRSNGALPAGGPVEHGDVAQALASWEDGILRGAQHQLPRHPLQAWLAEEMGSPAQAQALLERLERVTLRPGEVLFRQGEGADALYLVEEGRLSVFLGDEGAEHRIRTVQAGATVGEMGLYREGGRSATVRADVDSAVLRVSKAGLDAIERELPALAIGLHRLFVRLLASRLEHANANARAQAA